MADLVDIEGTELDEIEALVMSGGWRIVSTRILEEIERQRDSLERRNDEETTAFLRGSIGSLRTVLELPRILRTEFIQQGEK